MARKLLIFCGALALALPTAAQAATFCVGAPECVGQERASLQEALIAADTGEFPGPDRVEVGPGDYVGPFTADDDNPVDVVGAGRGRTVLTATANGATVLALAAPASAVRGVTVRIGGSAMTGLVAPRAEGVAIDAASPATGFVGISVPGGLVAENVTIELAGGATSTGVQVGPGASATLRHLTIAGAGDGSGVVVNAGTPVEEPPAGPSATLRDSVITGVARPIVTTGFDCPVGSPGCSASVPATVTTAYSAYDPATVATTGPGGVSVDTPPVTAAPRLGDDLRPRHDSPLVDAGDPAAGGGTDASGAARVVDGDGDGGARRDIGALEYQRRAPAISAAGATPQSAPVGTPVAFSAMAADPDGEALAATWSFSDGGTATGLATAHAFAAPGAAKATLTVADPTGLTATATVPVTITAAPPPPSGGGEARPGATRPRAVARVVPDAVRLRAIARRDRKAPFRFRLRGRVVLPDGISTAGCAGGVVRLAIRAGKRRLTRSAKVAAGCSFRRTLSLGRKRARRVVVTSHFLGTAALTPRDGAALRLRAG